MKDKKKLVLLLICLIVITIICVTIMIILKKAKTSNYEEHLVDDPIEIKEEFIEVNNNSYFYTIKGIMNDFISYVKQVNGDQYLNLEKLNMTENEAKSRLQQEGIKTIKELLDEQYTSDISISNESLIQQLSQYKQKGNCKENVYYSFRIEDMLIKDLNESIQLVLVKAQLTNKDFDVLIKLDNTNKLYPISLQDYI